MFQGKLFNQALSSSFQHFDIEDGELRYCAQFIQHSSADKIYTSLLDTLKWRQDHIKMFGKDVMIPRLQAWYGDSNACYTYSGLRMKPLSWTQDLLLLKGRCEEAASSKFNSVLANLYRDGQDSMGAHADNETELGMQPTIASLSFGQTRRFDLIHRISKRRVSIELEHGSLLIMSGTTQDYWQHSIAKTKRPLKPRINLTFRKILSEI